MYLEVRNNDGKVVGLTQGFGLGVRKHDDVMLAYNYSRFTRHEVSLAPGEFLVLRLDVNNVKLHHAEFRQLESTEGSLRFKLYDATGNEGLFPATPTLMPIFNQNGLAKETVGVDVLAEFSYYPPETSNPFSSLTPADNKPLTAETTGGAVKATPTLFSSVKGRHYTPGNTYALVVENVSSNTTIVYYQYDFHEIPEGGNY